MDPAGILLPGAQALVTQILSDSWAQARGWLASRLSRAGGPSQEELERRLDSAREQATGLPVPGAGVSQPVARRMVLEAYWAGYLAATTGEHPDVIAALTELADNQGPRSAATATNLVTGTVRGNVLQAGTIEGGVRFD